MAHKFKQNIACSMEDCLYNEIGQEHCSLDGIKVCPCKADAKEATDSFCASFRARKGQNHG
nr:DUF1540 domain-containing protein [bacterium]